MQLVEAKRTRRQIKIVKKIEIVQDLKFVLFITMFLEEPCDICKFYNFTVNVFFSLLFMQIELFCKKKL